MLGLKGLSILITLYLIVIWSLFTSCGFNPSRAPRLEFFESFVNFRFRISNFCVYSLVKYFCDFFSDYFFLFSTGQTSHLLFIFFSRHTLNSITNYQIYSLKLWNQSWRPVALVPNYRIPCRKSNELEPAEVLIQCEWLKPLMVCDMSAVPTYKKSDFN